MIGHSCVANTDVAAFGISKATFEHHVRLQGFWAGDGLPSRMPARICKAVGGRVSTNVWVRDLDLSVPVKERTASTRSWESVFAGLEAA